MKIVSDSEVREAHPNPEESRPCPECGWHGTFGDMKHALWLDAASPIHAGLRVQSGGDGMNYRCPKCNYCIMRVIYPKNRVIHK